MQGLIALRDWVRCIISLLRTCKTYSTVLSTNLRYWRGPVNPQTNPIENASHNGARAASRKDADSIPDGVAGIFH